MGVIQTRITVKNSRAGKASELTSAMLLAALHDTSFVTRCAGSAALAYELATWLGLGHPVWAVVSALIVSQDSSVETHRSYRWRVGGTAIGLCVAITINEGAGYLGAEMSGQIVAAVAICAIVARRWPLLRVCMWTAPLVLLTVDPGRSLIYAAIERGSEVLLGGAVGALVHLVVNRIIDSLHCRTTMSGPRQKPPSCNRPSSSPDQSR